MSDNTFYDFWDLADTAGINLVFMFSFQFRMMVVLVVKQLIFYEFHKSSAVTIHIYWADLRSLCILLRKHLKPSFDSFWKCVLLQIVNYTNVI